MKAQVTRAGFLHLEVGAVASELDFEPADGVLSTPLADVALDHEDGLPQQPTGLDAQEALAQHEQAGETQQSVGI